MIRWLLIDIVFFWSLYPAFIFLTTSVNGSKIITKSNRDESP